MESSDMSDGRYDFQADVKRLLQQLDRQRELRSGVVIDLDAEKKKREARRSRRLSQVTGPQGRNPVRSAGPDSDE
jgi:hypothetical protein